MKSSMYVMPWKESILVHSKLTQSCGLTNIENYWVSGPFPSSGILENTTFRKLDLFPSSDEGGGKDTYSVGSLRKSQYLPLN
jgi:hypothetical protein